MNEIKPWEKTTLPVSRHKKGALCMHNIDDWSKNYFSQAKRVYWIVNDTNEIAIRGGHYHPKRPGKKEILFCLSGKARIELHSKGKCEHIDLEQINEGLIIKLRTWHRVYLDPGSVLLAIASTKKDPLESIEDLPCDCEN